MMPEGMPASQESYSENSWGGGGGGTANKI